MKRVNGMIVLLGPGRSGTTSLYQAFRDCSGYEVANEKEIGALSFSFHAYESQIRSLVEKSVYVESTPSNLMASAELVVNVRRLDLDFVHYFIVKRSVRDRLISLYMHHKKLGNFTDSFDRFVEECRLLVEAWDAEFDGTQDITFSGFVEYGTSLLDNLPVSDVTVLDFENLFDQLNGALLSLGLPTVTEVRRNRAYSPRSALVDRFVLQAYQRFGLTKWKKLEALKGIYRNINAKREYDASMSGDTSRLLDQYERKWSNDLKRFATIAEEKGKFVVRNPEISGE